MNPEDTVKSMATEAARRPPLRYSLFFLLSLVQFLLIVALPLALKLYARTIDDSKVFMRQLSGDTLLVVVVGFAVWVPAAVTTGNALHASRGKSILAWAAFVLVAIPILPFLRIWYLFLSSR